MGYFEKCRNCCSSPEDCDFAQYISIYFNIFFQYIFFQYIFNIFFIYFEKCRNFCSSPEDCNFAQGSKPDCEKGLKVGTGIKFDDGNDADIMLIGMLVMLMLCCCTGWEMESNCWLECWQCWWWGGNWNKIADDLNVSDADVSPAAMLMVGWETESNGWLEW